MTTTHVDGVFVRYELSHPILEERTFSYERLEEEVSTKSKDPNLLERTIFVSLSHIQGKAIETTEYKNCHGCEWE